MRKMNMKVTAKIAFVPVILLLLACRPANDNVPKADQPAVATGDSSAGALSSTNDRTTVLRKLSTELNELDTKMADLKTKAQKAGEQAKADWEAQRPKLEAQREAAAKKLAELKESSKEVWDQTRTK